MAIDDCPPIGLAYLAGSLRAGGHTVTGIDAVGDGFEVFRPLESVPGILEHGLTPADIAARIPAETEMVGVTCMFSSEWPHVRRLLEVIGAARPDVTLVVGGEHVTAVTEFVLTSAPAVNFAVLGEGEETIVELADRLSRGEKAETLLGDIAGVAGLRDGKFVGAPRRKRIADIDAIPEPYWDIFPMELYISTGSSFGVDRGRSMPIVGSRGCPYECTFCSSPLMWTTKWSARRPENVIAEMKLYMERYGATNFDFYDLTAIIRKDWVVEFAQAVKRENLGITWQLPTGTRSEVIDAEVTQLLFESGCRDMNYAPESGNPDILKRIKKKVSLDKMLTSMRDACNSGLAVKANIMMGFPGERKRDLLPTYRFIVQLARLGVQDTSCYAFSPYPGSELFNDLEEVGRVELSDDYLKQMVCYSDPGKAVSYSEHMSDRFVRFATHAGMALFYGVSLATHPRRIKTLFQHLAVEGRAQTKLEKALARKLSPRVPV